MIPLLAFGLAAGAVVAAIAAVLVGAASDTLYLGALIAAASGAALYAAHLLFCRADLASWAAAAPLGVVVGLLGVAASGASCGVACLAIGAPVASIGLIAPDFEILRRLRRF